MSERPASRLRVLQAVEGTGQESSDYTMAVLIADPAGLKDTVIPMNGDEAIALARRLMDVSDRGPAKAVR